MTIYLQRNKNLPEDIDWYVIIRGVKICVKESVISGDGLAQYNSGKQSLMFSVICCSNI